MSTPAPLFPVFLKLADRAVVIVGGGSVATAKLRALLDANARVTVVAPEVTPEIAGSGMAPVLQIGRMDVGPENEEEWNQWYSSISVPNYEKVPGCIRGRRWKAVRGEPSYAVVYELENEKVSESPEWAAQRAIDPNAARIRPMMTHADGSPGI